MMDTDLKGEEGSSRWEEEGGVGEGRHQERERRRTILCLLFLGEGDRGAITFSLFLSLGLDYINLVQLLRQIDTDTTYNQKYYASLCYGFDSAG